MDRPVADADADGAAPEEETGVTARFAALAFPAYRLLFFAGLFVFLGVQAQIIARGWLAQELTGSNAGVGGVYLGFGIPMLLLTPFGGVAADRLPKRLVLMGSQALLVISAFGIGFAEAAGVLQYWMLVVASALQATGFALYGPARISFTGELVGTRFVPNAVVLAQMSMNTTRVFGPATAGFLIGVPAVGAEGVYFMTAALMLVALVITSRLPAGLPAPNRPERSVLGELTDGLRYVRANPQIMLLLLASYAVVMGGFPFLALLPNMVDDVFAADASAYGVMSAMQAIGAVAVSLKIASIAGGPSGSRVQVLCGAGFGLGLIALAVSPTLVVAFAAIALMGGAASGFQSMNNSLALTQSDLAFHGRVQSLMMLSFSGFGIAALPLGRVADSVGIRQTLIGMGLFVIASIGVYALARRRVGSGQPTPALG